MLNTCPLSYSEDKGHKELAPRANKACPASYSKPSASKGDPEFDMGSAFFEYDLKSLQRDTLY